MLYLKTRTLFTCLERRKQFGSSQRAARIWALRSSSLVFDRLNQCAGELALAEREAVESMEELPPRLDKTTFFVNCLLDGKRELLKAVKFKFKSKLTFADQASAGR